jgi:hypothetical protein
LRDGGGDAVGGYQERGEPCAGLFGGGGEGTHQESMFFFEKKNQKTFARWPTRKLEPVRVRWCGRQGKSFLLLFFKKEGLSVFMLVRPRACR